jgi:DNA-binding IclR family transcriptional regulator
MIPLGRESASAKDPRGVQSVEVGILFAFLSVPEPQKLRDIADRAGVSPAQDEERGKYLLGEWALDLALTRMQSFDPLRAAEGFCAVLRDQTGLTVSLSVYGSFGPTVELMRDGHEQVYINTRVGTVYSITGTATGMAFAAHLSDPEVRAAIDLERREPLGYRRVGRARDFETVRDELGAVRKTGYATIHPNPAAGIAAIASHVIDHMGGVRMVMTPIGTEANPGLKSGSAACEALLTVTGRMSFEPGHAHKAPL